MRHPAPCSPARPAAAPWLLLTLAGVLAAPPARAEGAAEIPAADAPGSAVAEEPATAEEPAASAGRGARRVVVPLDPRRLVPHYEYLEDSYLDYFFPNVGPARNTTAAGDTVRDEPLFFDAQAAVHLFVWNQWARVQELRFRDRWLLVNSLGVSFLLRARMVQEYSAPVRPPSYIPRIDYQLYALRRAGADRVDQLELRITPWGHHSNGQQACAFAVGVTDDAPTPGRAQCIRPDPRTGNYRDALNFRSGDFSTSYFIVGGHYAHIGLDAGSWTKWRVGMGGLFEGNPRPWGPGTIIAQDAPLYGQWRAQIDAEARYHLDALLGMKWLRGLGSLTASGTRMWPVAPGISGHRVVVELAYQPDDFRGAGGFVRYFDGQDDLNILYAAGRTQRIMLGVLWSASPQVQYLFGGAR